MESTFYGYQTASKAINQNQNKMKRLIFVFALAAMFAACNTTAPEATPEQLPVNASQGIYGVTSTQAVWPVWSVQVSWERKLPVYVDAYGPTTHLIQLANRPQLSDIQKYIPQPYYLKGKYTATAVFSIVQVGARQEPVEQNPPTKNE